MHEQSTDTAKQGSNEASLKPLEVAQGVQPCPCVCRQGSSCSSCSKESIVLQRTIPAFSRMWVAWLHAALD